MLFLYDTFKTKWGDMFLANSEKGLCAALFIESADTFTPDQAMALLKTSSDSDLVQKDPEALSEVKKQLKEYFSGARKFFDLNLDLRGGTEFQTKVWSLLLEIPFGEIWTYQDMAIAAGNANKVRAIGGAVGKNPIVLIVPCHRVVGKSGKLVGFSSLGGVELKKKILDHEGINLNSGTDYQIPLI